MAPTTNDRPKRSARLRDKAPEDSALPVVAPSDPEDSAAPPPKSLKLDVNAIAQLAVQDFENAPGYAPYPASSRHAFEVPSDPEATRVPPQVGMPCIRYRRLHVHQGLDELFRVYKNMPTQPQIEWLVDRGVIQLPDKKDKANAMIARLKRELPATVDQMDFIKILWGQHQKTTPVPNDLTEDTASALITQLKKTRPTTEAQRSQLRAFGVAEADVRFFSLHCLPLTFHFLIPVADSSLLSESERGN